MVSRSSSSLRDHTAAFEAAAAGSGEGALGGQTVGLGPGEAAAAAVQRQQLSEADLAAAIAGTAAPRNFVVERQ